MKTIFLDIDGCIFRHFNSGACTQFSYRPQLLPGVRKKFDEWARKDYTIILTTGRKSSHLRTLKRDLLRAGLYWSHIIIDLPRGERVVINDCKPDGAQTARAISLKRNQGLEGIKT